MPLVPTNKDSGGYTEENLKKPCAGYLHWGTLWKKILWCKEYHILCAGSFWLLQTNLRLCERGDKYSFLTYIFKFISILISIFKLCYFQKSYSLWTFICSDLVPCVTCNPDCSICMNCCDCPMDLCTPPCFYTRVFICFLS